MKRKISFLMFCMALLSLGAVAQDASSDSHGIKVTIPEVAILDVEGGESVSLSFTEPTEAGKEVVGSTNSALWLNYSSIKAGAGSYRSISVKVNQLIPGADVKVAAAEYAGSGRGTLGNPAGEITLTLDDQVLIQEIGSCYTGDGVNNGHNLTYTLDVNGVYEDLVAAADTQLAVTYTISN